MRLSFLLFVTLIITSCGGSGGVNLSGYTTTDLAGSGVKAQKFTQDGTLSEEGYLAGGKMNGVWLTYHPDGKMKSLTTYVDNLKTGPHLEFNTRGQIELKANFNGGEFHGPYGKYKSGRALTESTYVNGKLHGDYKEFFPSGRDAGKIQKLVEMKNGVNDGKLEFYDNDGNVTLSYQYKDGVKVE